MFNNFCTFLTDTSVVLSSLPDFNGFSVFLLCFFIYVFINTFLLTRTHMKKSSPSKILANPAFSLVYSLGIKFMFPPKIAILSCFLRPEDLVSSRRCFKLEYVCLFAHYMPWVQIYLQHEQGKEDRQRSGKLTSHKFQPSMAF